MATTKNIVFKIDIEGTGKAEQSLEGLENRIDKLKELRQGEQIGSQAFNDLSRDIQKAESAIKNVELQFESLDFEQKLTAGTDAVVGIAGGFAAAQGAAALFGAESEAVEVALTKVAAALTISMGLRDFANGIIALRKFSKAQKIAAVATRIFNAAMAANPIGLIIVAIAALIAGIMALIGWFSRSASASEIAYKKEQEATENLIKEKEKEIKLINKKIERAKLASKIAQAALSDELKLARANNASKEDLLLIENKLRKEKADALLEEMRGNKAIIAGNKELTDQIHRQLLTAKVLKKQNNLTDEQAEDALEKGELSVQKSIESQKLQIRQKEILIEINKIKTEQEIAGIEFIQDKEDDADKKNKDRNSKKGKRGDEALELARQQRQAEEADLNAFYAAIEEAETEHFDSFKTTQELEKQKVKDKFFNLIELAKKYGQDTSLLEKARTKAIADIDKAAADEAKVIADEAIAQAELDFAEFLMAKEELENEFLDSQLSIKDQEINAVRDKYNEMILLAEEYGEDTKTLEEARASEIAEIEKRIRTEKLQQGLTAASGFATSLTSLNDAVLANQVKGLEEGDARRVEFERKAFERSKKLQIAQALISAAQGVVSILSTPSLLPIPIAGVFKAIQIGILAATTAAQISKIKSAQFGGGGGGSIGSAGGGGASAGAGGVPINNISNTASLIDQNQQNVTQVVVVETDITNTQNTVAAVTESATF
tara:strand:+ start:79 stop:2238 length:2160 start_codon:yes stop_codon:yes gene_type:complete